MKNIVRDNIILCKVVYLNRCIINGYRKQQYIKTGRIGIAVYTGLGNIRITPSLEVNKHSVHKSVSFHPARTDIRQSPSRHFSYLRKKIVIVIIKISEIIFCT
mgnify:CR=1 FL=1